MSAPTWKCPSCRTVNSRHSGACMVCGEAEATAATKPVVESEMPTVRVEVVPPPSKVSKEPISAAARTTAGRVATARATAPPKPPAKPAAPTPPVPKRPARRSRSRKFAVGKLLGVGHVALLMSAIQLFLAHFQWGIRQLTGVRSLSVHFGAPVSDATAGSWEANHVISDSYDWLSHLPWGAADNTYFVLAIACLIIRLTRSAPGWLSLAVALPAAVYGLLAGISMFPVLAIYWPLSGITLAVAWVVVGKTAR